MSARKPTDATLRNTQAANKKFAKLTEKIRALERRVKVLEKRWRAPVRHR